jgi:hypothetical protein
LKNSKFHANFSKMNQIPYFAAEIDEINQSLLLFHVLRTASVRQNVQI